MSHPDGFYVCWHDSNFVFLWINCLSFYLTRHHLLVNESIGPSSWHLTKPYLQSICTQITFYDRLQRLLQLNQTNCIYFVIIFFPLNYILFLYQHFKSFCKRWYRVNASVEWRVSGFIKYKIISCNCVLISMLFISISIFMAERYSNSMVDQCDSLYLHTFHNWHTNKL